MRSLARAVFPALIGAAWLVLAIVWTVWPDGWPLLGLALSVLVGALALATVAPNLQLLGPVATHGPRDSTAVALTFDDGPHPVHTRRVVELLAGAGARGTFFVIGERVEAHPELLAELVAAGHQVAYHSHRHRWQATLRNGLVGADFAALRRAVVAAIGRAPRFFRPPIGLAAPPVHNLVRAGGMTLAGWSVRPYDGRLDDSDEVLRRVGSKIRGGDIVLLHDAPPLGGPDAEPSAVRALPGILGEIGRQGLVAVTIAELLDEPAYQGDDSVTADPTLPRHSRFQLAMWGTLTAVVLSLGIAATTGLARADEAPPAAAGKADLPVALEAVAQLLGQRATVQARFLQRKSSLLFTEDMVRTGLLLMRRADGRLLWNYDDGPSFLMAAGRFYPAGKAAGDLPPDAAAGYTMPGGGDFTGILESLFTLEPTALAKHFNARDLGEGRFELTPKGKAAGALFSKVTLTVGGDPTVLQRIQMEEATGDTTTIEFTDVQIDQPIPVERFETPAERSGSKGTRP